MDDDPLLQLAKEAFAKYDINASGTIDQKVHTIMTFVFLAVQNSSIGLIVLPLVPLSDTTNNQSLHNTTEQS